MYRYVHEEPWEAAVGEGLECKSEPLNVKDWYAIAVNREENIVGHVPPNTSFARIYFMHSGGAMNNEVKANDATQ